MNIKQEFSRFFETFGLNEVTEDMVDKTASLLGPLLDEVVAFEKEERRFQPTDVLRFPRLGYLELAAWPASIAARLSPYWLRRRLNNQFSDCLDKCFEEDVLQKIGIEWDSRLGALARFLLGHLQSVARGVLTPSELLRLARLELGKMRQTNRELAHEVARHDVVSRFVKQDLWKLSPTQLAISQVLVCALTFDDPPKLAELPFDQVVHLLRTESVTSLSASDLIEKQVTMLKAELMRIGGSKTTLAQASGVDAETVEMVLEHPSPKVPLGTIVRLAVSLRVELVGLGVSWATKSPTETLH